MPGYATRTIEIAVGDRRYVLRALLDKQQFSDPHGEAERAGISSATWSLFGQVWPSGIALAKAVDGIDIGGRRILEVGCGLALSSLVLHARGADITASDHHPLAPLFLADNARDNGLPTPPPYVDLAWESPPPELGRFDLVIAADVLYERGHAALLAGLLERLATPRGEVLIADPGRGNSGAFTTAMRRQGYEVTETRLPFEPGETPPHRGRLVHCRR